MEESGQSTKLCVICCVSYFPNSDKPCSLEENENFTKFSKKLEQDSKNNGSVKYSYGALVKTLKSLKENRLSVCSECEQYLIEAELTRSEVEVMEAHVITLQVELLEALRDLQGRMGRYQEEIKRVGELVKNSDGKCLEGQMEEIIGGGGGRGRRKTRNRAEEPNGVLLFRSAIVDVTSEFNVYMAALNKKLGMDLHKNNVSSNRPRRSKSSKIMETPSKEQKYNPTSSSLITVDEPIDIDGVYPCKIEVDMDDINEFGDYSMDDTDNPSQDDDWNNEMDSTNDEPAARETTDTDDDTDDDFSPTQEKRSNRKSKVSRRSSSTVAEGQPDSNKYRSDLETINFDELTGFRKRLIKRIIKKDRYRHNRSTEEEADSIHFKITKQYPIEYDKEREVMVIGKILVSIDDDREHLECSLCGYQSKPQGQTCKREAYMDRAMWNHILGKHLKALKCPICSKNVMAFPHLRKHLNDHKADSLDCDICGKPMASLQSLSGHKWTHMNEEEKQECERRGMKNPLIKAKREFQCSICGKELKGKESFEKHQLVHQQDREKVICPKCGKLLFQNSLYSYHLKYACRANDEAPQRLPCELCSVTFKTSVQKKKHMARMHNPVAALRPFTCPQCQKTFKTDDCLRGHLRTHNKDTRFVCSKGCGSSFHVKRYCSRHEKNCKSFAKREYNSYTYGHNY